MRRKFQKGEEERLRGCDIKYLGKFPLFHAEIFLSSIDKVVNVIKSKTLPERDGVIAIAKEKIGEILGDDAPSIEVIKGTPSFIFKLQRLGKKAEISSDGESLLIVGRDVPVEKVAEVKEKIRLKDEAKKAEESKIETDFYVPPKILKTIDQALENREAIFAFGMPGCGKSEMFARIAKSHNWEFERFELNGDMSKEDIYGFYEFKDGEGTRFVPGIVPKCMIAGKMLCLEEMDVAPNEILMTLQKLLEKNPDGSFKAMYNPMNGEQVVPHNEFRICATANTCGKGDETSLFPATHPLNDAFLDRWPIAFRMEYPSPDIEAMIIRKTTGVDEKMAVSIADFAEKSRKAFVDGKIYSTFSIRRSKNFATALKRGIKMNTALKITVLDRVSQEDAKALIEIANRLWGSAISG